MQNLTKKQPFYNGLQRFTHSKVLNSREYEEILQLKSKKDKIYKIIEKAPDNIKKEIEEIL